MPIISLIIPSYNGRHLLQTTLAKNLAKFSGVADIECIVVDDASQDDTVSWLTEYFPDVTVLVSVRNNGFAYAVSLGAAHATGDYLFFLNNDMELMALDLVNAYAHLQQDTVFALVPTIMRPSKNNTLESYTWGKFQGGWFSAESYLPSDASLWDGVPILWACGGALLVTRKKYDTLGGFDTLFSPFYFEDLDLCYRAWKRGLETRYVNFATVHHQHQATIGALYSATKVAHIHRTNHYLFMWKNIDDVACIVSHFITVLIKLVTFQLNDIRAIGGAVFKLPLIMTYRFKRPTPVLTDSEILAKSRPI